VFPLERSSRQAAVLLIRRREVQLRRPLLRHATHPQFGYDAERHALVQRHRQGGGLAQHQGVRRTGDAAKRRAGRRSCSTTNGNGKLDEFVEPNARHDPARTSASRARSLCGNAAPTDGSVWYTVGVFGGAPASCATIRRRIVGNLQYAEAGHGIRGGDIDKNGVAWAQPRMAAWDFDRRKCKGPLKGPPRLATMP